MASDSFAGTERLTRLISPLAKSTAETLDAIWDLSGWHLELAAKD